MFGTQPPSKYYSHESVFQLDIYKGTHYINVTCKTTVCVGLFQPYMTFLSYLKLCGFRLSPWCKWGFQSSGVLHCITSLKNKDLL